MGITRGAQTIVDRVSGWGHEDGSDDNRNDNAEELVQTDAAKQSTDSRLGNSRKTRVSSKTAVNSDIVDRGDDLAEVSATNYLDTDSGSNVVVNTTMTEALATGRTRESRDTVSLDDANATERAESARTSIRDRSDGWGHTDGSFAYRKDS